MSSLQLPLLLFSVNVKYQTSSNVHSVSQKLAHNQHKPTNKTEYSLFHIPSPFISLTEVFSIFFSILFKFENSSREINTAKLFIASHYGPLRGSQ